MSTQREQRQEQEENEQTKSYNTLFAQLIVKLVVFSIAVGFSLGLGAIAVGIGLGVGEFIWLILDVRKVRKLK